MNVKRIGAALIAAGALVIGAGAPGVITADSHDLRTASLHSAHVGASNQSFQTGSCPVSGYAWHFVLPGQLEFVGLSVTFANAGTISSYTSHPNAKHAYVVTPGFDTVQSATATVTGPPTQNERVILSHVCVPSNDTTTTIQPTTTTIEPTTTTIEPTTTTIQPTTTTIEPTTTTIQPTTTTIQPTTTTIEPTTTTGPGPEQLPPPEFVPPGPPEVVPPVPPAPEVVPPGVEQAPPPAVVTPVAPAPAPVAATSPRSLPSTGTSSWLMAAIATALLGAGVGFRQLARREV